MARVAPTAVLSLTLAAAGAAAPIAVPFGMHGPTYSHMRADPDVWERAQTTFDAFHQLGLDWARMDLWWGIVEPEPGQWQWDHFDRAIQSYADNDIALMAILCYGPAWDDARAPVTEEARAAWGEYVFNVVDRYKHTVREWEIWNEPNILPFWAPEPRAADYAEVLRIAYEQAKRADPTCTVVGGAMAGPDPDFLRGIFEAGAGECFDVLSYHNYGNTPARAGVRDELARLRGVLTAYGRADCPIWLSEHGIFTGPGGVSDGDQARDIVRLALWRFAEGVERSVYLSLRDWFGENDPQARDLWGLLDNQGQPKPSFFAVRTMARMIANRPFAGEVQLGPGVEAFLFGGQHDNALCVWSSDGSRELTFDAGVSHLLSVSLTGEEHLMTVADRTFTLPISDQPLWLNDVGDNLVLAAHVSTAPLTLARGESADLTLTVANPLQSGIVVAITPGEAQGITAPGAAFTLALAPGQSVASTTAITADDDAPVGVVDLPIEIEAGGAPLSLGRIVHHAAVTIAEPFTVARLPVRALRDGALPVVFAVANHTAENAEIAARLLIDGQASGEREVEIGANASQEVAFTLPLSALAPGAAVSASVEFSGLRHTAIAGEGLRVFTIPRLANEVTIDGDLAEWTAAATLSPEQFTEVDFNPNRNEGTADMAITGWLAWAPEGLYAAFRAADDLVDLPPDRMVWDWDGLQIALDTEHDGVPNTGFDYDDMEFEVGRLQDDSTLLFAGAYPPGRIADIVPEQSQVATHADQGGITYEMFFPAAVLDPMRLEAGALFGFNLIHNDADGQGREGWWELAPGIGWGKDPSRYPTGVLMP